MSDPHLQRANLLLHQGRFDVAEQELRGALAEDPDDAVAHTLLSVALCSQEKLAEAHDEARMAAHLAPDFPYAHYALADVLRHRGYLKEAEAAANEAVRLDPEDADPFGLLASIHIQQRRWKDVLEAAEAGLRLDPEHDACTNLRAMALVQLGRKDEADATIEGALSRDPENAVTHANQGWSLLHQGRHKEAMEHFREALRLNPELEWARAGIVEALKARHLVYGLMLRYFLWMSRLGSQAQWAVVLGAWFGVRVLRGIGQAVPAAKPFITPILLLYVLFAFLTWTADPLFNLLLRLNRFGRLALSREQIVASNWIGGTIGAGLLFFVAGLFLGSAALVLAGVVAVLLVIPLAGVFRCSEGWPRLAMATYTAVIALAGLGTALLIGFRTPGSQMPPAVATLGGLFLLGTFLSTWAANFLALVTPKK